jgi:hypothetical protein
VSSGVVSVGMVWAFVCGEARDAGGGLSAELAKDFRQGVVLRGYGVVGVPAVVGGDVASRISFS